MSYPFSEDHDMIREAAQGFLQDWFDGGKGPERIYQSGTAHDPSAWSSFAQELGMAGVAIEERYGGAQLGDLGRVVIMEELGASLCAIPFLTTCGLVADLIKTAGSEDIKSALLPKIAAGEITASYFDGHNAKQKMVSAVVDADSVDLLFFSRRKKDCLEIISIKKETKGLYVGVEKTLDPTRGFSSINWENVAKSDIEIIGSVTESQLQSVITQSFISLAAECIGGAQKCLDMTLEYAGQRIQFDRPIASFQAIKHRCADMFILIEAARSATYAAAIASDEEKIEAALIAKAYATDAFFKVAGDAIQLHGGIGFTWDYPLHFFFKRARANRAMFGTSEQSYKRLSDMIIGDAA